MIESFQNEKIKHLTRLISDNRFRKRTGTFVVEGRQENERAQKFNYAPVEYFICEEIYYGILPEEKTHFVSPNLYQKIAYRGTSEGIIGIYQETQKNLQEFKPKEDSSIIIVEGAEKPGNLGAILRSCEAFGIDALIVTDAKTDFYNANVIRSSVGCLFGMNIFQSTNEETLDFLNRYNYQILTTIMSEDSGEIQNSDFLKKTAICFGTEHSGLSEFWLNKGTNTLIPMSGTIDSLNLSNAVAITCYETLRQKKEIK